MFFAIVAKVLRVKNQSNKMQAANMTCFLDTVHVTGIIIFRLLNFKNILHYFYVLYPNVILIENSQVLHVVNVVRYTNYIDRLLGTIESDPRFK